MFDENFYDRLSPYYDVLQADLDPETFAKTAHDLIDKHCTCLGDGKDGKRILCDLGCGNGRVDRVFSKLGYDVIGVDSSYEMLDSARVEDDDLLWLCQDITELDLFGSCDVFVSLLDTINHILDEEDVRKIFKSFKNFLNVGGVFVFDIATLAHFKETLGDQVFFEDYDDFTLLWDNSYDEDECINEASLTLFERTEGDNYLRFDGVIEERYYEEKLLIKMGEEEGLKFVDRKDDGERVFLVFKREKL